VSHIIGGIRMKFLHNPVQGLRVVKEWKSDLGEVFYKKIGIQIGYTRTVRAMMLYCKHE
jgi:hypothetical protein